MHETLLHTVNDCNFEADSYIYIYTLYVYVTHIEREAFVFLTVLCCAWFTRETKRRTPIAFFRFPYMAKCFVREEGQNGGVFFFGVRSVPSKILT